MGRIIDIRYHEMRNPRQNMAINRHGTDQNTGAIPPSKFISILGGISLLCQKGKIFGLDSVTFFQINIADFFDHNWEKEKFSERYVACFHTRLDKAINLEKSGELKEQLVLKLAILDDHDRNLESGQLVETNRRKH